ncbi:hypothetical protein HYPSUDRAFT_219964 [Hypholoma sublateritium FD-334 SS-4]|uniref:Uncharacterized protein n=1 Tax=Hypholoma sublateritium (strain FD-334 SS-4) TaxID=945553 RepID=A0A0D2N8S7_HYPSF|nr:hypothetical protein HYPSUDRAFT_219964 [Hypholoma sublateritium FD-334 SS-4]
MSPFYRRQSASPALPSPSIHWRSAPLAPRNCDRPPTPIARPETRTHGRARSRPAAARLTTYHATTYYISYHLISITPPHHLSCCMRISPRPAPCITRTTVTISRAHACTPIDADATSPDPLAATCMLAPVHIARLDARITSVASTDARETQRRLYTPAGRMHASLDVMCVKRSDGFMYMHKLDSASTGSAPRTVD